MPGSRRPRVGRTRRRSPSTTTCSPRRATPCAASTPRGRHASRSSSPSPSTRSASASRSPSPSSRGGWRPTPSRGSTGCTSSPGPTRTTPGPRCRCGGGPSRPPASPRVPRRRRTDRPTSCCPTAHPPGSTVGRGRRSPSSQAVVHGESVDAGVLVGRPARRSRPTADAGAGPARRRRPPQRAGAGGRTRRIGQDPRAHRAPPPPPRRPRATSGRRCSPSPTTSRRSWRWRRAPPTSGRACARSTRSGCGCSPSTAARRRPCSTSRRCAG